MEPTYEIDGIGVEDDDIRYLFSYNLQRLAGLSTQIAQLDIKPKFGISMLEWRAIAVLDFLKVATLDTLAKRTGVQKSQMSRTVSALEKQTIIERDTNPEDKRSVHLKLTTKGKRLASDVLAASRERNRQMLADLSLEERAELMRLMEKVSISSMACLRNLKGESPVRRAPPPAIVFETD